MEKNLTGRRFVFNMCVVLTRVTVELWASRVTKSLNQTLALVFLIYFIKSKGVGAPREAARGKERKSLCP